MKLGALFSGGKDSAYAVYAARMQGHETACLLSILGGTEESKLLHRPNIRWTALQARSMGLPHLAASSSDDPAEELDVMGGLLGRAAAEFGIEGLVHGGIRSAYQKDRFARLCTEAGLELVSPLWGSDPAQHMRSLLDAGFEFIMSSVSAGGLDGSWLGRTITGEALAELEALSARHGFGLDFEGGEAETFVVNCPLFERPVIITRSSTTWDRYRGGFEILGAELG